MSSGYRPGLVLILWLSAFALFVMGQVLYALNQFGGDGAAFVEGWFLLISSLSVVTIGVLVLARTSNRTIGWLLYAIGLLLVASQVMDDYAVYALFTEPGLPLGRVAAVTEVVGGTALGLVAAYLFLLFPDGKLASPRFRPLLYMGTAAVATVTVGGLLRPGDLGGPFEGIDGPFGIPGTRAAFEALAVGALLALAFCLIAGLASLVVRFRRAEGVERRQLEWVFFGGAFLGLMMVVSMSLRAAGILSASAQSVVFSIGFTAVPVSMGIAILRYRLYDIDTIINRSLVYVPLTAILAGVYVAMTGLLRTLFTELTDWGSDAAIAFSTLVVAGSLTPLKNWLQAFVDRHFKETRDPLRETKRLATQARFVVEVLQQEAFLRRYLREMISAFGARGGMVQVGYSTFAEGYWDGESALEAELVCDGVARGRIVLGGRPGGVQYTGQERERFVELTEVIAEVISLNLVMLPGSVLPGFPPLGGEEPVDSLDLEEAR